MLKIPYILVVGDDDVAAGTVGVNRRGSQRPERGVELTEFTEALGARDRRAPAVPGSVSLDHLWAGWRSEYVISASSGQPGEASSPGDPTGDPSDDPAHCVFCRIAASGPPSADNGVLWVGP